MKRIVPISVLLLWAMVASAQLSYSFKIKYLPAYTYTTQLKQQIMMPDKAGEHEFITTNSELTIKTSAGDTSEYVKCTFVPVIRSMTIGGEGVYFHAGAYNNKASYGYAYPDGKIHIETVTGAIDDESARETVSEMISAYTRDLVFPQQAMKIGDTFTLQTMAILPIATLNEKVPLKTVYKLIAINKGIAEYETNLSTDFSIGNEAGEFLKGKGNGVGKLLFDMNKRYPVAINDEIKVNYIGATAGIHGLATIPSATKKIVTSIETKVLAGN